MGASASGVPSVATSVDDSGAITAAAALQTMNFAVPADGEPGDSDVPTLSAPSVAVGSSGSTLAPATALSLSEAAASLITGQDAAVLTGGGTGKHAQGGDAGSLAGGGDAAAGLSQLSSNTVGGSAAAPTLPTLRVNASVDSAEFAQGLSDRVSWMVDNGLNGARLQVNPPQLGPIELRIEVQGDRAQVWMSTHSEVTRDALESSTPQLREMLGSQGFGQVSVDISQRSFQDRSAYSQPYAWTPGAASDSAAPAAVSGASSAVPRVSLGAVDAYA
jgi:flagellar hook-length control protein FliK